MTAFWPSIEDQLAVLNQQATLALEDLEPEPDGLPSTASWIRAVRIDDDAQTIPLGP